MRKSKLVVGAGCLLGVAFACTDWQVWDDMFRRDALGPDTAGWTGGDGAMSVDLPGGRVLWLFGDSMMSGIDESGDRVTTAPGSTLRLGTTIGVQQDKTPGAQNIRFYQRREGDVIDVTELDADELEPLEPDAPPPISSYFTHEALGLSPTTEAGEPRYLWPAHGICIDCDDEITSNDRLFIGLLEWTRCHDVSAPNCFALSEGAEEGVGVLGSVLARVTDVHLDPSRWHMTAHRVGPGDVTWGSSFVRYADLLISYGSRRNVDGTYDVVAAFADLADLEDLGSARWSYLFTWNAWHAVSEQPEAWLLKPVARDVGAVFSLQQVSRRGMDRFVLVHAHPAGDHFLYLRTSADAFAFADIAPSTPKLDLVSIDTTLQLAIASDQLDGTPCQLLNIATHNGACSTSYHGLGHANLSSHDAHGVSTLLASYIVPTGDKARHIFFLQHGAYYRPRFVPIPLDHLDPWCEQAGGECWRGVAHQFNVTTLDDGQSSARVYDLSQGAGGEFLAGLTWASGAVDLDVTFYNTLFLPTYTCAVSSGDAEPSCRTTIPPGTAWATTTVTGRADGSQHTLRTHYPGR